MALSINVASSLCLRSSVLTTDAEFDQIRDEWDRLLDQSDQCAFFLRWDWNRSWWRTFKPSNSRLYIITCRDQYDNLVGVAPFYWKQHSTAGINHIREVLFLGTGVYAQTSEYLDVIARRGWEQAVARQVAKFLGSDQGWDRLWLNEIPSDSTMLPYLHSALGGDPEVSDCNRSFYIDTTMGWETFLRGLSRSSRQNIVRHTRQVFGSGRSRFYAVETEDELETATRALIRLHQARWQSKGEPGSFAIPGVKEFLGEAMRCCLRDGRLRLWALEIDGEIAAVQLGFFDGGVVHYLQGGFDPSRARNGLGTVMIGLCVKACMEDDSVREYDFMGGGDSYKECWTQLDRRNVSLTWTKPGVRAMAYDSIKHAKGIARRMARATLPSSVKEAGHRFLIRRKYYSN